MSIGQVCKAFSSQVIIGSVAGGGSTNGSIQVGWLPWGASPVAPVNIATSNIVSFPRKSQLTR